MLRPLRSHRRRAAAAAKFLCLAQGPLRGWINEWALIESIAPFQQDIESATIPAMTELHDRADRIRILMAEIPPMLSDIVRETVANEADMMVVGEFSKCTALFEVLAADGADVVIVGTSEPEESAVPYQILVTSPHIKVLMLETRGRRAVMYELRPHRTPLGDVSRQRLLEAIQRQPGGVLRE